MMDVTLNGQRAVAVETYCEESHGHCEFSVDRHVVCVKCMHVS